MKHAKIYIIKEAKMCGTVTQIVDGNAFVVSGEKVC